MHTPVYLIILLIILNLSLFSQDDTKTGKKNLTWTLTQLVPSPVIIQDADDNNARIILGLRWQFIPLNYSFRANRFITPFQFFMINPVRRFTGSAELFIQPEWTLGNYGYSKLNRFSLNTGIRTIIPVKGEGQTMAVSIGGKYRLQKDISGNDASHFGIETGLYFIYGMFGIQFNYNFNAGTKYNIGIYIKYF